MIYEDIEIKYQYWGLQSYLYKDSLLAIFTFQFECDVPHSSYITIYDGQNFKKYDAFKLNIRRGQGLFIRAGKKDELQIVTTSSRVTHFIVDAQKDTIINDRMYNSENLKWHSSNFVEFGQAISLTSILCIINRISHSIC